MEKIKNVLFENNRIYIETDLGNSFSRPLEAFPLLMEATNEEREAFVIGNLGDDIRWEKIDEDIHIDSFFKTEEPKYDNPIADAFRQFPQINVSEFARHIGINKSLMAKYIYGIKKPSEERKKEIEKGLHYLAESLLQVKIA